MSFGKHLFIRLLEHGDKHPRGFSWNQILDDKILNLQDWEKDLVEKYLENAWQNTVFTMNSGYNNLETPFLVVRKVESQENEATKYIINFDAAFKYIDYQELKQAQRNARRAMIWSVVTAILAIVGIVFSFEEFRDLFIRFL